MQSTVNGFLPSHFVTRAPYGTRVDIPFCTHHPSIGLKTKKIQREDDLLPPKSVKRGAFKSFARKRCVPFRRLRKKIRTLLDSNLVDNLTKYVSSGFVQKLIAESYKKNALFLFPFAGLEEASPWAWERPLYHPGSWSLDRTIRYPVDYRSRECFEFARKFLEEFSG